MSKIIQKVTNAGKTLYDHKKKTVFIGFLGYLGVDWLIQWNRNQNIRTAYAKQALVFGQQKISPDDRPRRVFVLVNVDGNQRKCFDAFKKNALPLFHLAGIQVDIVKADNEAQLEALAGAVDSQEADAIYVVGGDGTIGKTVTGIFRNREKALLPVGFYPGGYDNLWLKRIVPDVFEKPHDVRNACESAMSVIEDQKKVVYAFELNFVESTDAPEYGLGDVGAGWFRQIEETRKKLWYFGPMKRRWAYIWEMIKRSPVDLECEIEYEDPCIGCEKCRPKPIVTAPTWRWWHILTGPPKYKNSNAERDFTGIINENCGKTHRAHVKGADILMENEQMQDYSQIRMRVGGTNTSRIGVVSEGFSRCSEERVGSSSQEGFYTTDLLAKSISFNFSHIPNYINHLFVSSIKTDTQTTIETTTPGINTEGAETGTTTTEVTARKFVMKGTQKRLEVFLPNALRVDLQDV